MGVMILVEPQAGTYCWGLLITLLQGPYFKGLSRPMLLDGMLQQLAVLSIVHRLSINNPTLETQRQL